MSEGKIIFIVPPIQIEKIWGNLSMAGSILPPLGISILASLSRDNGFDTKVMDFLAEKKNLDTAVKNVLDENPDYIGITTTTDMFYSSVKFIQAIKRINQRIITLLGGPHISAVPFGTMDKFDCFDFGFVGESEDTLIDFLKVRKNKGDLSKVKGLIIRRNGKVIYTGIQQPIMDMDRIPSPAWDLLPDIRKYYNPAITNYRRKPTASLVTSRGCIGQCTFCDSSVFGHTLRAYSDNYVMKIIEYLIKKYGIKDICFYDDNFVAFRKRLVKICKNIIDRKIDLCWSCNARVDLVTPEILKLMRRAGCWQISYGIESGSQKILKILKKGIDIQQIEDAVRWTKQAGISARGFFMLGNPGETKEDVEMTRQLMLDLGLDDVLVEYFTPYPGTEAYSKIDDYGAFNTDWEKLNPFSISFIPRGLTLKYLAKQFKYFYRSFYLRPRIILNYIIRFRNFNKIFFLFREFIKFLFSR